MRHNGRTLYLDSLHHVDIEVLEILVTHGGRGLSLGGIQNPFDTGGLLFLLGIRGRLSLNSLSILNSEVLASTCSSIPGKVCLSHHSETLSLPASPGSSSNTAATCTFEGFKNFPPEIDSAFKDFPGKIVLMHHERRPIQNTRFRRMPL